MTENQSKTPGKITFTAYAVLFTAFVGLVFAKEFGLVDGLLAKRLIGSVFGGLMIVTGNFWPKLFHPSFAAISARRDRLIGWIFVLTGIALIVTLAALPDSSFELLTSIIGVSGFGAAILVAISARRAEVRLPAEHSSDPRLKRDMSLRLVALYIMHAIGWCYVMFLADAIWGDQAAIWTVMGFVFSNTIIAYFELQWRKALT